MAKKPKPAFAYASVTPTGSINIFWIRAQARTVRGDDKERWKVLRKRGWRVIKVKISAA
jgi:hypothetical protein